MTLDRELKRGSAEMMILSLVEDQPRHGYEILKLTEQRSDGVLKFHIGSVYPIFATSREARLDPGNVGSGQRAAAEELQDHGGGPQDPEGSAQHLARVGAGDRAGGGHRSCLIGSATSGRGYGSRG